MKTIFLDTKKIHDYQAPDTTGMFVSVPIEGLDAGQVEVVSSNTASRFNNVIVHHNMYRGRVITFTGEIFGDTISAYQTNRQSFIAASKVKSDGSPILLKFTTMTDLALQTEVWAQKPVLPDRDLTWTRYQLSLLAEDFRLYAQTPTVETYTANETDDSTNAGTEDTHAVFTITGPGNSIQVVNNDTSESFAIGDLSAGEVVVVDTKNETVTLDDVDSYSIFSGDFFRIRPGDNSLTFTVASGSDGNTELSVSFRSAYGGV